MPQEAGPDPSLPQHSGAPRGLLEQMEELMAALNADLSQFDADLQSTGERRPVGTPVGTPVETPVEMDSGAEREATT
ncbi:hypothetical protein [Streptomyces gobiensis]|uniref:hypothetical protein n=1 Tax=Streptomyces gobiensis TaxID=2875706 RepID=UPI001E4E627E|nr:hypothetical protein [Streptomyces gobiensis]UGY94091.1 hypothetical protein test1122_21810 [Streptomyces gobiensis]